MPDTILICIGILAAGLSLSLYADYHQNKLLEALGKPAASLSFIAAGYFWGAWDSSYGRWVMAGLVFGAIGDVLLIPRGTGRVFLGGMLSFALGHLFYVIGFGSLPQSLPGLAIATVGMTAFSIAILRWLMPHVPANFKRPVAAYIIIIGLMVVAAVGASSAGGSIWLAVGAIGFACSDLAVARHRFVQPAFFNRLWGLPLYFVSQLVIASTVAMGH